MTDIRERIQRLITDSGTYRQGQHDERQRIALLIDTRVEQLRGTMGIRNRGEICNELLRIRQQLNP
jgi:hypothetical protein